ncbi:MAG: DUF2062 domain-containing protein [Rhodocyclales bacterium]|nr:DUF2062 domain-containing protein [Rhodocyclales bacterium]MBI5785260.1 DUF2062 domain-containing protein [Rhodocyclales bacterium]
MRKRLRKLLPDHEAIRANRWLAPFQSTLLHPRLWHLNRHSAAGAVAAGLFCGLIPGPFQMLGAAICAVAFRVNLPLALLATFYTNPLTIVPLYVAAFALGKFSLGLVGAESGGRFVAPPDYGEAGLLGWIASLIDWTVQLGRPLAIGLILLAGLLAGIGYFATRFAWRLHLVYAWRQRAARRQHSKETA